jgi:hypothetical protein
VLRMLEKDLDAELRVSGLLQDSTASAYLVREGVNSMHRVMYRLVPWGKTLPCTRTRIQCNSTWP